MAIIVVPNGGVNTVGGAGTGAKIFQSSLAAGGNYTLQAPGSTRLNGQKFRVRMSGYAFGHTAATTLQLSLIGQAFANGAVAGNTVILALSSARTLQTAANGDFYLEADLIASGYQAFLANGTYSGTTIGGSGLLTGQFTDGIVNNTPALQIDAWATLSNNMTTNINTNQEPWMNFYAAVAFGTSDALNLATLTEFKLIQD